MFTISLSAATEAGIKNIDSAVKLYSDDRRAWLEHMKMVDETKTFQADKRYQPYPAPSAHPLIAACVDEAGIPDYTIEDDTAILVERAYQLKKNALFNLVTAHEHELLSQVVPPGKYRLWLIQENAIVSKINKIETDTLQAMALKGEVAVPGSIQDFAISKLSNDDRTAYEEIQKRKNATSKIDLWAAQAMHDIADLTQDTIDKWVMPEFKS